MFPSIPGLYPLDPCSTFLSLRQPKMSPIISNVPWVVVGGGGMQNRPLLRTTGVARAPLVVCRSGHCCYLDCDALVTVKPYTFELKPTWAHGVKNVYGKKGSERTAWSGASSTEVSPCAAFGNELVDQSLHTRLQGADVAF